MFGTKPHRAMEGMADMVLRTWRALCLLFAMVLVPLLGLPFLVLPLELVWARLPRGVQDFFLTRWFELVSFVLEHIGGLRLVLTAPAGHPHGAALLRCEPTVLVCNHRTEVDWLYLWPLAARWSCHRYIRTMLKSSLRHVPGAGWGMARFGFPLVHRRWEEDCGSLEGLLHRYAADKYPLWLAMYPEGTAMYPPAVAKSRAFAAKHDLPQLEHVLHPRTRGFAHCVQALRRHLGAVVDLTIGFPQMARGGPRPTPLDVLLGRFPREVHIHIERFDPASLPSRTGTPRDAPACPNPPRDTLEGWLNWRWQEKEKTLRRFNERGGSFEGRQLSWGDMGTSSQWYWARNILALLLFLPLLAAIAALLCVSPHARAYFMLAAAYYVGRSALS